MKPPVPLIVITLALAPQLALAHPGHVAEVSGHSHWLAFIALTAAAVVGVVALARKFLLNASEPSKGTNNQAGGRQS